MKRQFELLIGVEMKYCHLKTQRKLQDYGHTFIKHDDFL